MKRILIQILMLCLIPTLTCCNKETKLSAYEEFDNNKTFIDETIKRDLKTPDRTIKNLDDFIYLLDYLAFYRIGDEIFFDVGKDYQQTFYNPYQEYLKAYKQSDLADVYPCNLIDDYYSELKVIGIRFSISKNIATTTSDNVKYQVISSFNYQSIDDNLYDIGLKVDGIECETSEQLYYLIMNGYDYLVKDGSMADIIYREALKVLNCHVSNNMSDFEKIKSIYDYLTTEISYDFATAYSNSVYLQTNRAYYLEGVFLDKTAVCDGKSKAYAMLLNMCGIKCYRITGKNSSASHAYNVLQLDGKWYISCTTYGQPSPIEFEEGLTLVVPNYCMLLTSKETSFKDEWNYSFDKHIEIYDLLEKEGYDFYNLLSYYNLKIENLEQVKKLIEEISTNYDLKNKKIEFLYVGDNLNFQNELIDYLYTLENVNLLSPRSEKNIIYQVVFYEK